MSYSSADKDCDILPSNIEKFEFFDELSFEFMIIDDDFGFSFEESDDELNIKRSTHPLSVKTITNSKNYEIYYLLSFDRVISFSSIYKKMPNLSETKVVLKDLLNLTENNVTIFNPDYKTLISIQSLFSILFLH